MKNYKELEKRALDFWREPRKDIITIIGNPGEGRPYKTIKWGEMTHEEMIYALNPTELLKIVIDQLLREINEGLPIKNLL